MLTLAFALTSVLAVQAADVYVSPAGDDTAPGTQARPFATLDRARAAAHAGSTVWLAPGDYRLIRSLTLTAADSGVTWRAVEPGKARLLGARRVRPDEFKLVTDTATLARIPAAARGKVVELDLKPLGLQHTQRYPDLFIDNGGLLELYCNGRRMRLARYPHTGYLTIKRVLANGGGQAERGRWGDPKLKQSPVGPGVFEYREEVYDQMAAWRRQLDRGVWLKGYWRIPWQCEAVRVAAIDTTAHTVTLAKPVPGGIGNKYLRPEGSGQEPYWLFNLLEALDQPGEFCVDFADDKLYFYPPAPLDQLDLALADLAEPLVKLDGASSVTLRDLTFEQSLGEGVRITGGADNLVAGCTLRNLDRYAVHVDGGQRHAVQSCDLHNLGEGGVWLLGGDDKAEPRVPAGHRVVNCHIHHFSQITRVYTPAVNVGYVGGNGAGHKPAVGMLVAHNLIHDTPHAGVLSGSFDSIFEYNEVFRFATVSDDIGAFYCFDTYGLDGHRIFRYNLVHHSEQGDAFYFDMDHRDMEIYGNVVNLHSGKGRGTTVIFKDGTQLKSPPQRSQVYGNVGVNCNWFGLLFAADPAYNRVEGNAAIQCKTPWDCRVPAGAKWVKGAAPEGNRSYADNPGLADPERLDFRVTPGSVLARELPNLAKLPLAKIGLYLDEYRRRLPTDDEIQRYSLRAADAGLGYDILDRQ